VHVPQPPMLKCSETVCNVVSVSEWVESLYWMRWMFAIVGFGGSIQMSNIFRSFWGAPALFMVSFTLSCDLIYSSCRDILVNCAQVGWVQSWKMSATYSSARPMILSSVLNNRASS
jgi:hypothetical protein